jgi:hypothetical protein
MRTPIESVCWRLCACSEALASLGASAASYRLSKDIVIVPIIESELEFREIQRQVLLAYVMVRPDHTAFEQAPEVFQVIIISCQSPDATIQRRTLWRESVRSGSASDSIGASAFSE